MIDLRTLRENVHLMQENIADRNVEANAQFTLELYEQKNKVLAELEDLRKNRNENAQMVKSCAPEDRHHLIEQGKLLKDSISNLEQTLHDLTDRLFAESMKLPNYAHPDSPKGMEDEHNVQLHKVGTPTTFDFPPKDHVQLAESLNLVDFEAGARVSGAKFYFLKNQGVLLEWALVRYAMDKLVKHGFELYQTPDIAREEILIGIGFQPRGNESNTYLLEGTGSCLVGTAEITLGGYYADQIIDLSQGPLLLGGVSHCFRREAGSAGQFSKGLYRVHQFTKVEMFVFCHPQESDHWHEKLREIEEEIFTDLGIPYRVVDICRGTLGGPAYRKYDLEAWMPGRGDLGEYGEITSTSNCTDFQARRLNIRFKDGDGKNKVAHTLNGTAIAVSRALVAILENYQQKDGSILMPVALQPYLGFERIAAKK
ncbi:MAG: serine--tRNA ligase [Spirochaetia bacterium]